MSGTTMADGSTKSFLSMLDHVRRNGVEAAVVLPNRKGLYGELERLGIRVLALPYPFNVRPQSLKARIVWPVRRMLDRYSVRRLADFCRDFKPDLIHSNTSVNDIGYLAARELGIPHIWHIREYGLQDFNIIIPGLDERLAEPNNYSISITRDIARSRGVLDKPGHKVIYNGVVDECSMGETTGTGDYFLFAGRLEAAKGVDDCIEAFIMLHRWHPDIGVRLKIAGGETRTYAAELKRLKSRIAEAGLIGKVDWLGERRDVKELMKEAKAVVVSSYNEGFGRVMAEAMSVGCLVIGRQTGGTLEQIENSRQVVGYSVPFGFDNTEGLCKEMETIAGADSEAFCDTRLDGIRTVRELYTRRSNGEKVLDFYEQILQDKHNNPES